MIFDTHAHYDDSAFDEDRDEILSNMLMQNVGKIVNIGASLRTCRQTIELVAKYEDFYGVIGVHPSDTDELNDENFKELEEMLSHDRIVAVGEIGLDYHYDDTNKEIQQKWFIRQLELARKCKLPVVIHSRDAAKDTIDIMREQRANEIGGVVHCYSYSKEQAKEYLDMGFFFGIGGVLTFKNARKLVETVEYLPMEVMVLETDCPYLSPEPFRGKRNDSRNIQYVISKIAEIKGLSREEVEEITWDNACRLYRLSL